MTAYLYRIDTGYPGALTREPAPGDIIQEVKDSTVTWSMSNFGQAMTFNASGQITPVTSITTAPDIIGFLVRSFPGNSGAGTGGAWLLGGSIGSVARRGYISVALQGTGTADKFGSVYIRVSGATDTLLLGGVEATSGTGVIELPGAYFMGTASPKGIVEITFNQF